jgi:hypothetical protein
MANSIAQKMHSSWLSSPPPRGISHYPLRQTDANAIGAPIWNSWWWGLSTVNTPWYYYRKTTIYYV